MRSTMLQSLPALVLLMICSRPATAAVDRWTSLGPDGGTVQALAADPGTPGTLYAGTDGGGVWKSTDGGGHWRSPSHGLGSPDVFALATSPAAPGAVWAATHVGLFKSVDGGATWQRVWYDADRPDDTYTPWTLSVAVDPTDPDLVWLGTARGWILKTTDGGASWELLLDLLGEADRLLIDPDDPATVYANGRIGLFKTTDRGETWTRLLERHVHDVVLDPAAPRTLYLCGKPEGLTGVWKSTDGGATWSRLPGLDEWFIDRLLVDPFDPSVLLAGMGGALWRTEDAGATWQEVPGLPPILVLALAADPAQPGRIWLGANEWAVFRSLDAGGTWHASRQGLAASHIWAVAFDPVRPRTMYAAADNSGIHRSPDAGRSWSPISRGLPTSGEYGVTARTVAAHPLRPGTLFAGTGAGLSRSTDRGEHWSRLLSQGEVLSVAFDPHKPGTIFAGGENNLFRTRNGGRTWKHLSLPSGGHYEAEIAQVITHPRRPGTVYVLDFDSRHSTAESLFRSTDGGDTWELVFTGGATALALHPTRTNVLYLATKFGGEVWRSNDGGRTWEKVSAGVGRDATSLLVDRLDPSILYLGTDGAGVWRSTDRGVTWAPLGTGLIAPRITCLQASPLNPRRIIACTWGGGLLEIRLSSGS